MTVIYSIQNSLIFLDNQFLLMYREIAINNVLIEITIVKIHYIEFHTKSFTRISMSLKKIKSG